MIYTVSSGLSVPIFRVNMVYLESDLKKKCYLNMNSGQNVTVERFH